MAFCQDREREERYSSCEMTPYHSHSRKEVLVALEKLANVLFIH